MYPQANSSTSRLAAPTIWVAGGTFVFFAAWLFPPAWYTRIYEDKNFIFGDVRSFIFCSACILATIAGLTVAIYRRSRPRIVATPVSPFHSAPLTELLLILTCLLLTIGSIAILSRSGAVNAFGTAISSEGQGIRGGIRQDADDGESLGWETLMVPVSFAMPLVYFCVRSSDMRSRNRHLFYVLVAMYILVAIITTKRNYLVRPGFGCLLIFMAWPSVKRFSFDKGILVSASAVLTCLLMFVSLAFVRFGPDGVNSSASEIGRYLITPYNTAALIINDVLRMPGSGSGYYWTQFIWQFPVVSELLDLPTVRAEFFGDKPLHGALERGPLLKSYGITTGTAIPAFACSYIDFGWLGILPFFVSGVLCGFAWRSFLLGRLIGLCFYPVIAYSFLEWRANLLFPPSTLGFFMVVYFTLVFFRFIEVSLRRSNSVA